MSFETTLFGDGVSTTRVTTVSNNFGTRGPGKTVGVVKTEGVMHEMKIILDGDMLTADAFPLIAPNLPAGSIVEDVYIKVTEVFVLATGTPVVSVGTEGSETTNGFVISEAQMEATGTYDVTNTLQGTWASPLAASTTVGLDLVSGSTSTDAGKAVVVIRYALAGV